MSINRLPKYATTRFAELCDEVDAAHDRLLSTQRRIKSIEDQRRLLGAQDKAGFEALSDEIARIDETRERQRREFEQQSRLVAAVRTWIAGLPSNAEFETVAGPTEVAFVDGESTDSAIDRIRGSLRRPRSCARTSPAPRHPSRMRTMQHRCACENSRDAGRPTISLDLGRVSIKFVVEASFGGAPAADALAITAWLHPDELEANLCAEIDQQYVELAKTGAIVLAPAERDRRLPQLDAEILALERQEEQCITEAAGYGMTIPRRENANPLAL